MINLIKLTVIVYVSIIRDVALADSSLLKDYDSKVCKNEPSCHLADQQNLPKVRRMLPGRDCMCDFECVEFNDCCLDSEFYGAAGKRKESKNYHCSSDSQVYMIVTCPPEYTNQVVKRKCEESTKPLQGDDISVIRPTTNIIKRITYGNAYCALCNNDLEVELWNLTSGCGEAPPGYLNNMATRNKPSTNVDNDLPVHENSYTPETTYETTEVNPSYTTLTNDLFPPVTSKTAPGTDRPYHTIDYTNTGTSNGPVSKTSSGFFGPAGYSAKIKIPGLSVFNIEVKRLRREAKLSLDFNKYAKDLDKILKNVKYDASSGNFVSNYDNKNFICKFGTQMPKDFDLYTRKCVPNLISTCPPNTGKDLAEKCTSYTAITYEKATKKAFRNKDCAKCNGVAEDRISGCFQAVRAGASTLFSTGDKATGTPCNIPELKTKFCS